jgi:transposase-like protein
MPDRVGSPTISLRDVFGSKRLQERLIARSVRNASSECLEWQGCIGKNGYGMLGVGNKRVVQAHRAAYAAFNGEFDESLFVLHRCDNRKCINPDHLFVGTRFDNMRDMSAKRRDGPTRSKLSPSDVQSIFERLANGASNLDVAREFGVHPNTVSNIRRGKYWQREVPREGLPDGRRCKPRQTINLVRSTCALKRRPLSEARTFPMKGLKS